ncbi:hypothetical protein HER10_EVM0012137 [Colletotrichum scovillei]|uniref:DNA binding domain with preference for A/T rich regions-like protein n=1 Tax=Colletotrichum scovillei TaxID=1209932 RepID=A0A9P7QWL1_9PEZI|nr:uncharacterized protein HER10_EVM0012137 [Colletotrichum scovillei]KAF4775577.1 hypothetical protein HER10_EVM0012137 [Colletotrichum scovillei]KAG7042927.1 DNA binding domain with preference for A/T rich regions-like protein [Colletotrichum scovillei]KAG7043515.1 DNA binding domain with preference for A/T rich regions-like protein [Colletotrichum scovillei]KAG7062994.1 DNA binding domain with preference for A/T rich regions-like protein [Colletotrichum scovillei]
MATTAASPQISNPARRPTPLADASTATATGTGTGTAVGTGTDSSACNGSAVQTPVLGVTSEGGAANGFGVLQHTGPPVQDDIPGLYRDGRVRNPVPSKLKGKTDATKGNFGVMHIDLTTTNESRERDAAAKRTSEGTQLAARLAQTDRYIPIRRSKFIYRPEVHASNSPPQLNAPHPSAPQLNAPQLNKPQQNAPGHDKPQLNKPWPHQTQPNTPQPNTPQPNTPCPPKTPLITPQRNAPQLDRPQLNTPYIRETVEESAQVRRRTSTLTTVETIAEQARLLTLLRSLDPDLVVDQLCKGLKFFGGIANEHTSSGASFPISAEANGSGSLFVGWLAEIFPALDQGAMPSAHQTKLRRPRGRPKGSRNAKGKQAGHSVQRLASRAHAAGATTDNSAGDDAVERAAVDASWVDIDDTIADTDGESLQVDAERVVATPASSQVVSGPGASGGMPESGSAQTSTTTPAPKRRGRPKGSKNRPKDTVPSANDAHEDTNGVSETPVMIQPTAVNPPESSSTTEGLDELGSPLVKKRKGGPGRPKGSKNRPKGSANVPGSQSQQTPPGSAANDQRSEPQPTAAGDLALPAAGGGFTSSTREQQFEQRPAIPVNVASPFRPETVSESAAMKQQVSKTSRFAKRKRKASQEGRDSNAGNESLTAASASGPNNGRFTATTSESPSSPQMARSQGLQVQDHAHGHQPVTKRQKLPNHQHQDAASKGGMTQASQNSQTGEGGQRMPQLSEPTQTDLHTSSLTDARNSNLQRPRNQMGGAANRSSLQQALNAQQPQSDLRLQYSQSLIASSAGRGVERTEVAASYSLNMPSRQAMYNQDGSAQGQQQQNLFHQQEQHRPTTQNRSNDSQHRLSSSGTGRIPSTLGQNGDSYTESTSDGDYQGLVGLQQPTYGTHMTGSSSTRGDSYRTSTSRPIQQQSSTFHARQEHSVQNTGMSSFQDYSDSAFLASLTTANQANLAMNPTQYNVNGAEMQRASPNMNSTYGSSHLGQSSFGGGMTESAMRERMYHTSRRQ